MTKLSKAATKAIAKTQVARKEAYLKPLRAQLYRAAAVHFARQSDALLGQLRRRGHVLNEAVCMEGLSDDIDAILTDIFAETRGQFADAMAATLQRAMSGAVSHRLADFDLKISFDLANPAAQKALRDYCAQTISGIDASTRRAVKQTIISGEQSGASYTEIARSLVKKFDSFGEPSAISHIRNRAELIAVNELGRAYETSSNQAVYALQSKGLPMRKSWNDAGDDKVCEGCLANAADGWIPIDDLHTSGDPHPPHDPGCRCTECYELDSEEAEKQLAG